MPIYQLSPGDLFNGKYRIEQQLGQGGMAVVYRVTEIGEVATEHALKLIRLPSFPSQEALALAKKRFRQEAAIQAKVRHPHIVGIHRYDVAADGTPYLLMELLDGEDLAAVLKRVHCLPWERALRVLEQTALALSALHKEGLVHRDLSPANIFLVQQGTAPPESAIFVKLLDFGIAKRGTALNRGLSTQFTSPAVRIGNPPYMAPECILHKPKKSAPPEGTLSELAASPPHPSEPEEPLFDGRADEFSLASIFFEMLTGRKAFLPPGADPVQAFARVMNADPLAGELPPIFTSAVRAVLARAFSKDPDARYDTVLDFVAALREIAPSQVGLSQPQQSGPHSVLRGDDAAAALALTQATDDLALAHASGMPSRHAGSALSPHFIVLAGLFATVALLCISAYDQQLRDAMEQLGILKERRIASQLVIARPRVPASPDILSQDMPTPIPAIAAVEKPVFDRLDAGADMNFERDDGGPSPASSSHSFASKKIVPSSSPGETVKPPSKKERQPGVPSPKPALRITHSYSDAQQQERAAQALDIFHKIIADCLKRQRNWNQIEIIAMSRLHASGLPTGDANQDLSNCLNDRLPASVLPPRRTIVKRAK